MNVMRWTFFLQKIILFKLEARTMKHIGLLFSSKLASKICSFRIFFLSLIFWTSNLKKNDIRPVSFKKKKTKIEVIFFQDFYFISNLVVSFINLLKLHDIILVSWSISFFTLLKKKLKERKKNIIYD